MRKTYNNNNHNKKKICIEKRKRHPKIKLGQLVTRLGVNSSSVLKYHKNNVPMQRSTRALGDMSAELTDEVVAKASTSSLPLVLREKAEGRIRD